MAPDPEVSILLQVVYDTPRGMGSLRVTEYTPAVVERGIRCQLGHRKPGESEQCSAPLYLDEALHTEVSAGVLDGESLYVRLVDQQGRDLSATKIDEARWPRDATPTTVKTMSYWLYAPNHRLQATANSLRCAAAIGGA
jgi:hypothetical protein